MNFPDAIGGLLAELTPQPWDYTTPDGTTLRVIPAGLRSNPGEAEVLIRITSPDVSGLYEFGLTGPATKGAAEIGITTADLPTLVTALEEQAGWEHAEGWGDPTRVLVAPTLQVTVTEGHHDDGRWIAVTEVVQLPQGQRLPLAAALRRAWDVAVGWEDGVPCAECPTEVPVRTTFCSTRCRNAADRHDDLDGDL
ncbi:hypothetical protein OG252_13390 [Streptomyces sp. NBC_01352]|uniref:hypothetical protein n=1 Tax=Streptomyces sp. NBC_01352 TaxID=2903834 RepID=UPI002E365567|nr:hypothetical protein [Streptomyces sp. NBC_01352]